MKKTTAIKEFRCISLPCPSLGQSTVPGRGRRQRRCFHVHTGSVAAGLPRLYWACSNEAWFKSHIYILINSKKQRLLWNSANNRSWRLGRRQVWGSLSHRSVWTYSDYCFNCRTKQDTVSLMWQWPLQSPPVYCDQETNWETSDLLYTLLLIWTLGLMLKSSAGHGLNTLPASTLNSTQ